MRVCAIRALGHLEFEALHVDGKRLTLDYGYNADGHLSSITYPDNRRVEFAPDGFGQSTKAERMANQTEPALSYASNAQYYPNGLLDSFAYNNGFSHKTTLNLRQLPESIKDAKAGQAVLEYHYQYDNNENITKLEDRLNPIYSLTELTYDGLNRLSTTTGDATGIGSSAITYDALGNITSYNSKGRDLTYQYNGHTNRLESVSATGQNAKQYERFGYDVRGNVTDNSHHTFVYNLANQMIEANDNRYTYDGHNRRVVIEDAQGTSYSFYSQSGQLLYRETVHGGINYIYLGQRLVAKDGVIPEKAGKQHFRPFGSSIEGEIDDAGYTGHKFDTDLGLSYMQARYYDPVIGRFYSNDPIGFTGEVDTFNRYSYVANNPYKFTDPTGEAKVLSTALKAIADKYGWGECKQCASEMSDAVSEAGQAGTRLDARAPGGQNIWSDKYGGNISTNGDHAAVEVDGLVYDNINGDGVPRPEWEADLHTPSGQLEVNETPIGTGHSGGGSSTAASVAAAVIGVVEVLETVIDPIGAALHVPEVGCATLTPCE